MEKIVVAQYKDNKLRVKVVDAPKSEDLLKFMYEEIGCTMVQVVYFDGFDAWVDEEGLYNSGSPVYKYTQHEAPLVGNIVFTKGVDEEGNTTFFDDKEDQDTILNIMKMLSDARFVGVVS